MVTRGTRGNDTIIGGDRADDIRGLGGDDLLPGGSGGGDLRGGAGSDSLQGQTGDDVLDGGRSLELDPARQAPRELAASEPGDDRLLGFARFGRLVLDAGDGSDEVRGTAETLTLRGRGGGDTLHVGFADQPDEMTEGTRARLTGGGGNDQLFGGLGVNTLHGGSGDDILVSFGRNDTLTGGAGRDLLGIVGPYETVRTRDVVTDLVRGEDRLYIQGRRFADFDTNGDGVLDGTITAVGADQVTIADVTLNGVTRGSTILMLTAVALAAGPEAPQGGVLAPDSKLIVFGVTRLTADDFLPPAEM